jgi:glutamate dehydrogenase
VPSLSTILPALHNAGVAIDREQAYSLRVTARAFVTSLSVDAASAAKLAQPSVVAVAEELFAALFNNGRRWPPEWPGHRRRPVVREVQLVRAYSYWRQAGSRFSVRYIAESLRKQPAHVKALVDAFLQRFDPALSDAQHAAAWKPSPPSRPPAVREPRRHRGNAGRAG